MTSLQEIIQNWCNEANKPAMLNIDHKKKTINICTQYPGCFIGYHGRLFYEKEALIKGLKEYNKYKIKFIDCREFFQPGDNWGAILQERMEAFFELEG